MSGNAALEMHSIFRFDFSLSVGFPVHFVVPLLMWRVSYIQGSVLGAPPQLS